MIQQNARLVPRRAKITVVRARKSRCFAITLLRDVELAENQRCLGERRAGPVFLCGTARVLGQCTPAQLFDFRRDFSGAPHVLPQQRHCRGIDTRVIRLRDRISRDRVLVCGFVDLVSSEQMPFVIFGVRRRERQVLVCSGERAHRFCVGAAVLAQCRQYFVRPAERTAPCQRQSL